MPQVRPAAVVTAVVLFAVVIGIAVRLKSPAGALPAQAPTAGSAPVESAAAAVPVSLETPSRAPAIEAPSGPIGSPADPLPAPLLVAGNADDLAGQLAQIVAAGGPTALPALLAALQKSGITVYGPDDAVAVAAEGPDQGLSFESWEVRAMLGVIGRKHASLPLTTFAAGLVSELPELRDQPVARLLARDIIVQAHASDAPTRFWARFIIELGKQPHRYKPYDLQADVANVSLDAIQLSLITQRLAADLTTVAGGAHDEAGFFSLPVVYAAEPCAPSPSRPAAKGQPIRLRIGAERGRPQRDRGSRSHQPKHEKFRELPGSLFLLNALRVDVEMEGGPPLKRTKTTEAGEARKIRATVSIGGTVLEWDTCLGNAIRIGQGRDNNWYRPGPVPDVPVDWDLDGRGIVRIPMSAPAAERGLPDAAKTDAQGITRLAVEGAPQTRNLKPTARERRRTAAAAASVKVKFGDLVHRLAGADNSLASGLNNWIFDQEITVDVPYPFEVIDGPTVRVTGPGRSRSWTRRSAGSRVRRIRSGRHGVAGDRDETDRRELVDTVSEHGDAGSLVARSKARFEARTRASRRTPAGPRSRVARPRAAR